MDEETKQQINQILQGIERIEKIMAMNQAQLDAAIAALPAQIEAAVESSTTTELETALAPVIANLQQIASQNGLDFTNEINSLNAIPGTVAPAVATQVSTSVVNNFTPPSALVSSATTSAQLGKAS